MRVNVTGSQTAWPCILSLLGHTTRKPPSEIIHEQLDWFLLIVVTVAFCLQLHIYEIN